MSITRSKIIFSLVTIFFYVSLNFNAEASSTRRWLDAKAVFATNKILENVSPSDGLPGAVLAAKSRVSPDYYYHWVRDAALTMMSLINVYQTTHDVKVKNNIEQQLWNYLFFSKAIQNNTSNLGEPKFYVTGDVYNKPWGRPQNDGPALRVISLIQFANILLADGKEIIVREKLYQSQLPATSPIKMDLEYISHHWKDPSFDLWEEVQGTHFYTLMVIRRALIEGAILANNLGDISAGKWYSLQAKEIELELLNFWDEEKGYLTATINRTAGIDYKTSNLDMAVILGLLHGNMHDGFLSWDHPHVKATIRKITDTFQQLYPINQNQHYPGIAIGRYPEDRYSGNNFDGGNPWPLCTLALAEALYNEANMFKQRNQFSHAREIVKKADKFVERVKAHAYPDSTLDEQIDRRTGYMTSARDLTWNYAALLSARQAAMTYARS